MLKLFISLVKKVIRKISIFLVYLTNFISLKINDVKYGKNLVINGKIIIDNIGKITIGNNVKINSSLRSNLIGGCSRTILRTVDNGEISIGNNVGMSNTCIVSMFKVTIEDNVMIGGDCKVYDTDFHSLDFDKRLQMPDTDIRKKPIVIKNGAFIGAHTIILKGNIIGEKSIIGAGSVVSTNIPDGEIWAGNPIRFIRKI